jgi:ketosteroid isomerase-like protein
MRKNGDVKYSAIDVSDKKVRVHGNTAILTATVNMKGTMKNDDISGTYRIAQVWVRQSGKWKVANMQSTKVQGTGS